LLFITSSAAQSHIGDDAATVPRHNNVLEKLPTFYHSVSVSSSFVKGEKWQSYSEPKSQYRTRYMARVSEDAVD